MLPNIWPITNIRHRAENIRKMSIILWKTNEENSPTFDRRVSPLVRAATQGSNVWVLSVEGKEERKINKLGLHCFLSFAPIFVFFAPFLVYESFPLFS
jgi:hypothetical protein